MALLNLTAFTPQMAYSVCATLQALGGDTEATRLSEWMSPESLYVESKRPRTLGLGLRESLGLCETLGLVSFSDGRAVLSESFESIDAFRRTLRARVLAPDLNLDLFEPAPTGGVRAHELTRALAWFLQLRTSLGPYSTANYENYQSDGARVIENNNRWNVFDRWVVFLGFGWRIGEGLLPDPTRAIADQLDELLNPGDELSLPAFVTELSVRLPVLEGGAYHRSYLTAIGNDESWDARRLSEPLSLALMRLQRRNMLELFGGGDAEARVLRIGSDVDRSNQFVRRPTLVATPA
jgi:hypothetical protein